MTADRTEQNEPGVGWRHNASLDPTRQTYLSFQEAFAFFNSVLFDDGLPDCLFNMERSKRSRGHFASERFKLRPIGEKDPFVDEINLNPRAFIGRSDCEIVSTLVHEMVHCWQDHHGKPGRRGYHNKEWAAKMLAIGLIPSHTGEPGGKQTGEQMSHYIRPGGAYDREWRKLVASGFVLGYQDRYALRPEDPKKVKVRYACPACSIHVWGKPQLLIVCERCQERMR